MEEPKLPHTLAKINFKGHGTEIIIGIAGLIIAYAGYRASKSNASTSASSTDPVETSTSGTSTNGTTDTTGDALAAALQLAQIQSQQAVQIATVQSQNDLDFSFAQTNTDKDSNSSTSVGGGGFSLFGLGSIGGSGGKTGSTTTDNSIQESLNVSGLNQSQLNILTQLAGNLSETQDQATNGTNTAVHHA